MFVMNEDLAVVQSVKLDRMHGKIFFISNYVP